MWHLELDQFTAMNWLLMCMVAVWLSLNAWQLMSYRPWARHRFGVDIATPKAFPVQLLEWPVFTLADGATCSGRKDCREGFLDGGWDGATAVPSDCRNLHRPVSVSLSWASLTERQFYRGTFVLPERECNEIIRYFRRHPAHMERSFGSEPFVTYVVGICSEGRVLFWVNGNTLKHAGPLITKPLASFQAAPFTPPPGAHYSKEMTAVAFFDDLEQKVGERDKASIPAPSPFFDGDESWSLGVFLRAVAEQRAHIYLYFHHFREVEPFLQRFEHIDFDVHAISEPLLQMVSLCLNGMSASPAERDRINRFFVAFMKLELGQIAGTALGDFYADAMVAVAYGTVDEELGEQMLARALEYPTPHARLAFNLACIYARRTDKEKMLHFIARAIEQGFDARKFVSDTDFSAYQLDEEFRRLVARPSVPSTSDSARLTVRS